MTTSTRRAAALPRVALVIARFAPASVAVLAAPLLVDAALGLPGAVQELHHRAPDVLGKAALATLVASYAITPITTLTGWRWHVLLRRDFGIWTFAFCFTDLVLAAALEPGGWRLGVAGSAGLAAGTLATLLLVPLALTSSRWSMRLLGRDWKRLHLLIYPVFGLAACHLVLVGSPAFALAFLGVTTALGLLRLRRVERFLVRARRSRA